MIQVPCNTQSKVNLEKIRENEIQYDFHSSQLGYAYENRRNAVQNAKAQFQNMRHTKRLLYDAKHWNYLRDILYNVKSYKHDIGYHLREKKDYAQRIAELCKQTRYMEIDNPGYKYGIITQDNGAMLSIFRVGVATINIQLCDGFPTIIELHNKEWIEEFSKRFEMITYASYRAPHGKRNGTLNDRVTEIVRALQNIYSPPAEEPVKKKKVKRKKDEDVPLPVEGMPADRLPWE